MNQGYKTTHVGGKPVTQQPIQRTLIVTMGPVAGALTSYFPSAFSDAAALASIVALLDIAAAHDDLAGTIRSQLASISRAGSREDLAASGYVIDRMKELALFIIVDVASQGASSAVSKVIAQVAGIAQEGWGLDTRTFIIALADDWSESAALAGLRTLAESAPESLAALMPLNRVNELGLELDTHEAFLEKVAAIVEALVTTPLRDMPQWTTSLPDSVLSAPILTAVGLECWTWHPELVRDELMQAWKARVIRHWLAEAQPEQKRLAAQQAASWFDAQGLSPQPLVAMLEPSVSPYAIPAWQLPYPWRATETINQLCRRSSDLAAGHGMAVELVVAGWEDWLTGQERNLRAELAARLDREPVTGLNLGITFLQELALITDDAEFVASTQRDELEEQATDLAARLDETLAEIKTVFTKWPADDPISWATVLLRPWRWPRLVWEYWTLHNQAREVEQLVALQVAVEREQVLAAAAAALYQHFGSAVRAAISHLEEIADMLQFGGAVPGAEPYTPAADLIARTVAQDGTEATAADTAVQLGGLGCQVHKLDDRLLDELTALGRQRYHHLIKTPAVDILPSLYEDEATLAAWWQRRWAAATPLWLYDDALQTEASRLAGQSTTVVCAAGADKLCALLSLPALPDWRWISMKDPQRIIVMRWRSGVVFQ